MLQVSAERGAGQPVRLRRDNPGRRLEREIRRAIDTGGLKPHDRLRGEKALAAQYGMGLQAVRAAIRGLRAAGYLYTKPRSGVFVAGPTGWADSGFHLASASSRCSAQDQPGTQSPSAS